MGLARPHSRLQITPRAVSPHVKLHSPTSRTRGQASGTSRRRRPGHWVARCKPGRMYMAAWEMMTRNEPRGRGRLRCGVDDGMQVVRRAGRLLLHRRLQAPSSLTVCGSSQGRSTTCDTCAIRARKIVALERCSPTRGSQLRSFPHHASFQAVTLRPASLHDSPRTMSTARGCLFSCPPHPRPATCLLEAQHSTTRMLLMA